MIFSPSPSQSPPPPSQSFHSPRVPLTEISPTEFNNTSQVSKVVGSDFPNSNDIVLPPAPHPIRNPPPSPSSTASKGGRPRRNSPSPPLPIRLKSLTATIAEERAENRRISEDFLALKNPSGRQYSLEERRLLLTQMHGAMERRGLEEFQAINLIADVTGCHVNTLRSLYDEWKSERTVPSPSSSIRGSANLSHPLHFPPFSIDVECRIHSVIAELNQTKGFCNTADIQSILKSEFSIEISRSGLSRRLRSLGYQWGRSQSVGTMTIAARRARTVIYVKELSLAISEEKLGGAVICFIDESYVNVRHKIQYTWWSPYSPQRNEVGGPSGRGEREILLHAICKFGLIGDDISGRSEASDLAKSLPSAQHFFVGGYIGEDYHKNIDGDFFIQWLLHRFIPAFEVKIPHKKCILVLDNAPYHHAKDGEFIKLGGTKKEIIDNLNKLNVNSIEVQRKGRVKRMDSSTWNHHKSLYAPSTSELLDALKVAVAAHPESQLSAVRKIFNQRGWQLIFTPPYTPQCQPIEKVWAYVKHHIASLFEPHRNAAVLLTQTILSFYGDPSGDWPGVTEEFCQSLINYSYKWCDQFIHMHMKEGGNLSTLAAHLSENPLEEAVVEEIEDEVEGAREEGENEVVDIFDFDNSLNED